MNTEKMTPETRKVFEYIRQNESPSPKGGVPLKVKGRVLLPPAPNAVDDHQVALEAPLSNLTGRRKLAKPTGRSSKVAQNETKKSTEGPARKKKRRRRRTSTKTLTIYPKTRGTNPLASLNAYQKQLKQLQKEINTTDKQNCCLSVKINSLNNLEDKLLKTFSLARGVRSKLGKNRDIDYLEIQEKLIAKIDDLLQKLQKKISDRTKELAALQTKSKGSVASRCCCKVCKKI